MSPFEFVGELPDILPEDVDDLPLAAGALGQGQVIDEEGAIRPDDAMVLVVSRMVTLIARLSAGTRLRPAPGKLDHLILGQMRELLLARRRNDFEEPFGQLRVEGPVHALGVAFEPAFDIVERGLADGGFLGSSTELGEATEVMRPKTTRDRTIAKLFFMRTLLNQVSGCQY